MTLRTHGRLALPLLILASGPWSSWAAMKDIPHPYILLTREEAADIRKRIETEPLVRKQYENFVATDKGGGKSRSPCYINLFKYLVMGDKAAGQTEKSALLGFIGVKPPGATDGNPETSNAPWRDDRTLEGLRYDVLYDELSPEQRKGVEDTFRFYIGWFEKNPGPCARPGLPRTGWLPNMQWPTAAGIHVMAVASRDEDLIRRVFSATGGWKWFFDEYIADGQFYMEEFCKYGVNVGAMLHWCQALERLGLNELGWGYTGQKPAGSDKVGGATMEKHLAMLITAGYPRVNRSVGTPDYPAVTMGDAGDAAVVHGYYPAPQIIKDGKPVVPDSPWAGGHYYWGGARMNGWNPKMNHPLWWEAGHRKFPNAGYDYFLAQMRKPGEDLYLPTLYFGIRPIDPTQVKPPAVKSYIAPERGFAMLRAEESPAYWESPKPAVALQFGMYYVHYVHDSFAIHQFVADNRMVYTRQGYVRGGYAGGDPCRDSVRGKASGVVVDSLQANFADSGEDGIRNERLRHRFTPPAKFVSIATKPPSGDALPSNTLPRTLYPGVQQERALVLTDDYLLDVSWLKSDTEHIYDWHAQAGGIFVGVDRQPWTDSDDLGNGSFWDPRLNPTNSPAPDPTHVRKKPLGGDDWAQSVIQTGSGNNAAGIRVAMLGEKGSALYALTLPGCSTNVHSTLLVRRTSPSTTFAVLHEPFKGGVDGHRIERMERLAETPDVLAVSLHGRANAGIEDRIIIGAGPEPMKEVTVSSADESFTVSDFAWIRIGTDTIDAWGGISSLRIKTGGKKNLHINGAAVSAIADNGAIVFEATKDHGNR